MSKNNANTNVDTLFSAFDRQRFLRPLLALTLTAAVCCGGASDNEKYRCSTVCAKLADKGCVLKTDQGSAGATALGGTGCEQSCAQSATTSGKDCSSEWAAYADCLLGDTRLVCDVYWLDQVKGCDEERLAWDQCDGAVCDARGGLSGTGTTSEGTAYFVDYGWLDCDCEAGKTAGELGSVRCGDTPCPKVCCCDGQIAAGVCLDGQCASAEKACKLLQEPPFSACVASGS